MGQTVIKHAPIQAGVICSRFLTLGSDSPALKRPIMMERMRMCKRDFRRGLVGDFRSHYNGGPRKLLPIVGR